MIGEKSAGFASTRIGRGTQVLEENLPLGHFESHKSHVNKIFTYAPFYL
jgi:hypothetical protein